MRTKASGPQPDLRLLVSDDDRPLGTRVLNALLGLGARAIAGLHDSARREDRPGAALTRLRGTGRGIHFSDLVRAMETDHPIQLKAPFEGSDLVAGGVWVAPNRMDRSFSGHRSPGEDAALAKLCWSAGADDLPLHVHDHSDRFIIVLEGRGFFHLSGQSPAHFNGRGVRSIPARERDVFVFTRGLLHTFSTAEHAMTLLSVQMPYLSFDDPDQYRLPERRWIARDNPEPVRPVVACDPWWAIGAGGC